MDLAWPESQEGSFPKEQAELRMCATASPRHSHHHQRGGSCQPEPLQSALLRQEPS